MIRSRTLALTLVELVRVGGETKGLELFIRFVNERGLRDMLPAVVRQLALYGVQERIAATVTVTTSHPVALRLVEHITQYINAPADAPVEHVVDKELVGGFTAVHDYQLCDASIQTQLVRLREQLAASI